MRVAGVLITTLLFMSSTSEDSPCITVPSMVQHLQFSSNGSCFYFFSTPYEARTAAELCRNYSASLSMMKTRKAQDALLTLIKTEIGVTEAFTIGLTFIDQQWHWIDGEILDNPQRFERTESQDPDADYSYAAVLPPEYFKIIAGRDWFKVLCVSANIDINTDATSAFTSAKDGTVSVSDGVPPLTSTFPGQISTSTPSVEALTTHSDGTVNPLSGSGYRQTATDCNSTNNAKGGTLAAYYEYKVLQPLKPEDFQVLFMLHQPCSKLTCALTCSRQIACNYFRYLPETRACTLIRTRLTHFCTG